MKGKKKQIITRPPEPQNTTHSNKDPAELQQPSAHTPGSSCVCTSKPRHRPCPSCYKQPTEYITPTLQYIPVDAESEVRSVEEERRENQQNLSYYKTISTTTATITNSQQKFNHHKTYNNNTATINLYKTYNSNYNYKLIISRPFLQVY